eukprot:94757-Hanusia_phi.AAC.7
MQLPSSPSLDLFAETERLGMIRAFGNEMIFAALVLCFSIFVKRIYTSIELAARFKDNAGLEAPPPAFFLRFIIQVSGDGIVHVLQEISIHSFVGKPDDHVYIVHEGCYCGPYGAVPSTTSMDLQQSNELYKKYESLQEEVKGLREQNKLLKELYGIKDIQNGGVQRVQRLAELEVLWLDDDREGQGTHLSFQSAYITKRTKVVTDDKKGGSDVDQGN